MVGNETGAKKGARISAERRAAQAHERFERAMLEPTLVGAQETYSTRQAFWMQAKREGRTEEVKEKYAEDRKAARRKGWEAAALTNRANAPYLDRPGDLMEDIDFLARTGEHPERAAKRLGYHSYGTLERSVHRLHRNGKVETTEPLSRLLANNRLGLEGTFDNGCRSW